MTRSDKKLYTQADVIQLMKEKGLGRPSTYGQIISTLISRGYIMEVKFGRLIPTKKGIGVYQFLSEKYKDILDKIAELKVVELSELVKTLEEKFGVSAAAPIAVAAAPAAGNGAPAEEEKTSFNVVLTKVGEKKIEVIKVVRDATGKGLKEAKDLVDAAAAGAQVVKEGAGKDEATELKKKLETAGATVELK